MKRLIIGLILIVCLLLPVSCAKAPTMRINTIDDACDSLDIYLYNLAKTPDAKRLLAEYKDNMWSCNSCVVVVDYNQNRKHVYSERDYEGWNVKEYIIQHIFDSEFEPGTEMLQQVLKSGSCFHNCGPRGETTYPVTWVVDRQTGAATPYDSNALRVEAELLVSTPAPMLAFVGSVNSDVYHYPSCVWAQQIYPQNEIWFDSPADARAHGYRPCKVCKPPG